MTTIAPGSVGPIKYYNKYQNVFNGDLNSYQEMDSGVLFQDWERWTAVNQNYETRLASYDQLRVAYNTVIEQH